MPESGWAAGLGSDPAAAAWNTVELGWRGEGRGGFGGFGAAPPARPIPPRPATSISTSSRDNRMAGPSHRSERMRLSSAGAVLEPRCRGRGWPLDFRPVSTRPKCSGRRRRVPSVPHAALPASHSAGCAAAPADELARAQTGAPDSAPPAVAQRDLMDLLAKVLGRAQDRGRQPPAGGALFFRRSRSTRLRSAVRVATTALLRLGPPPATSASTAGVTVSYTTSSSSTSWRARTFSARATSSCFRVTGSTWIPRSPHGLGPRGEDWRTTWSTG